MSIAVEHLSFSYGNRVVLHDLSFVAKSGDLLCILGPNGVGKSTLFRCMLSLQKNYQGRVHIDGRDVGKLSPAKLAQKMAYIPQYHTPAFNYSVFHTVLMGTTPHISTLSSPGKAQEEATMAALERFGIAHLRDRNYAQLSGGERQLTLIARAVVQQAKILIMDEPTANLDYGNQVRVMEQIRHLSADGYTIVLATHSPEHVLLYANCVMVLLDGKILRFGSPETVVTEELLRQVYRIDVGLPTIEVDGQTMRVCVPLRRLEEGG